MEYEYDLTEALAVLGLPPVEIHWRPVPKSQTAYGGASPGFPNEVWINLDNCEEDEKDVAEIIGHELVHLWQYRHFTLEEMFHYHSWGYENDPLEGMAFEYGPAVARLIKRIK